MDLIDELDCNHCQCLVMAYFKRIYHNAILFYTRYSVLYSYAEWFNEGRSKFLHMEGVSASPQHLLRDANGIPIRDNLLEYTQSDSSTMLSPCYQFDRVPHTPIEVTVNAHADDVALFWRNQDHFYQRWILPLSPRY